MFPPISLEIFILKITTLTYLYNYERKSMPFLSLSKISWLIDLKIQYTEMLSEKSQSQQREYHPILNQIYDKLAELHNQGKQTVLCKVLAHIGIKGTKEVYTTTKQVIDMPGITTTRLPQTNYCLTIRSARNFQWKKKWENNTSKLHYIKPRIESAHNSCR